ncbi:hypothetical protein TM239_15340 [Bradyrhizobium sp. TM239]|nr:hypothetical protein TM239_15340 [Bradyrhizobium sp. TM239]
MDQPPPEKPWPNEPKPPRLTLLWPESEDDVPAEEWLDESLLKKLDRDDQRELLPPDELLPPLLVQVVVVCPGTAPGVGSQVCRGIIV